MGATFSSPEASVPDKYYDGFVKGMESQQGKVFAITGTTSGTGFEAAKALAGRGATVICLNRSVLILTDILHEALVIDYAQHIVSIWRYRLKFIRQRKRAIAGIYSPPKQ